MALLDTLSFAQQLEDAQLENGSETSTFASLRASHALASAAFARLLPHERDEFSQAWYLHAQARLQINHFRCQVPVPLHVAASDPALLSGSTGAAVFAFGSLFNHSCVPNVDVQWLRGNADATFRTQLDVAQGEELTVSYVDSFLGVKERRQRLLFGWGFECQCTACQNDAANDQGQGDRAASQ